MRRSTQIQLVVFLVAFSVAKGSDSTPANGGPNRLRDIWVEVAVQKQCIGEQTYAGQVSLRECQELCTGECGFIEYGRGRECYLVIGDCSAYLSHPNYNVYKHLGREEPGRGGSSSATNLKGWRLFARASSCPGEEAFHGTLALQSCEALCDSVKGCSFIEWNPGNCYLVKDDCGGQALVPGSYDIFHRSSIMIPTDETPPASSERLYPAQRVNVQESSFSVPPVAIIGGGIGAAFAILVIIIIAVAVRRRRVPQRDIEIGTAAMLQHPSPPAPVAPVLGALETLPTLVPGGYQQM